MTKLDPYKLLDMADDLRRIVELEGFTPAFRWARDIEGRAGMILEREGIQGHTGITSQEVDDDA